MSETLKLKLTAYLPVIGVDSAQQTGFEYDLTVLIPPLTAPRGKHAEAFPGKCEVVPVTGTLSFPNPAAPVISPFTGVMFIYDGGPAIGFALNMIATSTGATLPFSMTMAFPASPVYFYAGAITFGAWPGPLTDTTASFLAPH